MDKLTEISTVTDGEEVEQKMGSKVVDKLPGNMDRLRPRGLEKNLKRRSTASDSNDRKKLKEGQEEMEKLKSLVPTLRLRDGRVSQVDIIEETISYIDQLHRRVAERLMASTVELRDEAGETLSSTEQYSASSARLTLEQVETAERMSQDMPGSASGGFAARLAELSRAGLGGRQEEDEQGGRDQAGCSNRQETNNKNETFEKIKNVPNQNMEDTERKERDKDKQSDNSEKDFEKEKLKEDQKRAIEAVKASFVALLNSPPPDD